MSSTPRPVRFVALTLAAVALAGCTGSGLSPSNFDLAPDRIGWNIGEEASFTLTLEPTLTRKDPSYTVDADFAIAELNLDRKGGVGGSYSTKASTDVDLYLVQNGSRVEDVALDTGNATVGVRLTLPESLRDSEYVLELRLFEVGWVESAPFRVNVP